MRPRRSTLSRSRGRREPRDVTLSHVHMVCASLSVRSSPCSRSRRVNSARFRTLTEPPLRTSPILGSAAVGVALSSEMPKSVRHWLKTSPRPVWCPWCCFWISVCVSALLKCGRTAKALAAEVPRDAGLKFCEEKLVSRAALVSVPRPKPNICRKPETRPAPAYSTARNTLYLPPPAPPRVRAAAILPPPSAGGGTFFQFN